ncbi:hypothetical protein WR25_13095 [Diploscapter pachys]|uniref:Uncharacterized protein n=1 Tax=Diploscapter pachys TaxID=2018661 RepID=A0A2A2LGH5_9BILA|nr:hypothetical protein WR25_13095 [Diploscapter pachys]
MCQYFSAVEMVRSGTIEIVNSRYIVDQSLKMRNCIRVVRGQANRYDFVQNYFPPRSRMKRRNLPYNPLQMEEEVAESDPDGNGDGDSDGDED